LIAFSENAAWLLFNDRWFVDSIDLSAAGGAAQVFHDNSNSVESKGAGRWRD
jgi:hypothetical protein